MAVLVGILGAPDSPDEALARFRQLWLYGATMALIAGAASSGLRPDADHARPTRS